MRGISLALTLALALATPALAAAVRVERSTLKAGTVEVPVEIAIPEGKGPFPPVLYVHARRGYEDPDREHVRTLASQGFLVVAPEVMKITSPVLFLVGDQDFELRRINIGRAFYALVERGVPAELQTYPMARRAFDFRADATPEEKIATRHARERVRAWLARWVCRPQGR